MAGITPEQVLAYNGPTNDFLCPLSANAYNIEFYRFTIRNMSTQQIIFDVERKPEDYAAFNSYLPNLTKEQETAARSIRYRFPTNFLDHKVVGSKLVFGVNGNRPVPTFRMIERHYFRNVLIKSFDFKFGFCIPHSTNTWEAIYDMPQLTEEWKKAIVASPFETVSDSFYFVGDELIMHNKAYYAFDGEELQTI